MSRDIQSTIQLGDVSLTRQGFTSPLIVGYTGAKRELTFQNMVFGHRGNFNVSITISPDDSATTIAYENSTSTIKIILGVGKDEMPVANVVTVYENLGDQVSNLFTLEATSDGGDVTTGTAESESLGLIQINNISETLKYYDTDDLEYKAVSNMLSQNTKPNKVFLFDAKGLSTEDLYEGIESVDWYGLTTTSTDHTTINDLVDFVQTRRKIAGFTVSDLAFADELSAKKRVIVYVQKDPNDQLAMSHIAENLPKPAGSVHWKYTGSLVGQTADNYTLTELNTIRENNAITLEKKGNLTFSTDGVFTDGSKIIDTIFNDYVNTRLEEAFLEYSVNKSKITITNKDFDEVRTVWGSVFTQLKTDSVSGGFSYYITPAETNEQINNSYNGADQAQIDLPTASEYKVSNVEDVKANLLTFSWRYVKAGVIDFITITGRAVGRIN